MPFKCLSCTQCCKRYNISLLPEEAERISSHLGISLKEFMQTFTELFVQLFPSQFKQDKLIVSSSNFSKELSEKIFQEQGFHASHFLLLPGIILKRLPEGCVFLKENLCSIHSVKPEPCNLFPFISWDPERDLRKDYKFCEGLQASGEKVLMQQKHLNQHEEYYEKVKNNFEAIKQNGFHSLWKFLPIKGKLLAREKQIQEISLKEFKELVGLLQG